ncbi:pseudouridine synthase [Tenuibacillus multivorans]|uniref:Pseudouridine synthase n=1 Tax=Tenuibacillus multivorans TaxID=237069 RepID=A0A1H0ECN5_9BACI|nr:pseudouridine synthase [Tenuibacillus multivorans]GEL77213.1 pseudouridine synthase [Tenuibacillus multivorans]SDN80100.1 16S rRNA pseudouridine516 synthase [Tenuibacillus multivorans]
MRLDKLLANQGFGSRKDVKQLIKKGKVTIDGEAVKSSSFHVDPKQSEVIVNGKTLDYRDYIYIMMNKPKGVISATRDDKETCVTDLLDEFYTPFSLFPVGRLDKDTVGLMLITNDGELSHQLLSPKQHVDKVYEAKIKGLVTDADVDAFKKGVCLEDGYVTKPAKLEILTADAYSDVRVTISEGKFHQIKRMFDARGHEVVELKRLKIGSLVLDHHLDYGEYRELTEEELKQLQKH